jgi:hypothetical protein
VPKPISSRNGKIAAGAMMGLVLSVAIAEIVKKKQIKVNAIVIRVFMPQ